MASNSDNLYTEEEFLERFKVQQHDVPARANNDSHRMVMLLASALSSNIITDIHCHYFLQQHTTMLEVIW